MPNQLSTNQSLLLLSWKDKGSGELKFIRFDVVTNQTFEAITTITSHPVEEGTDVADNQRPDPVRFTLEAYVSNKPLLSNPGVEDLAAYESIPLKLEPLPSAISLSTFTPGGLTRAVTGAIGGLLHPEPSRATVLKPKGSYPDRAREMFDKIDKLRLAGTRFAIISRSVKVLEDMVIERLATPRTPEDGNGLNFQIDFVQIRVVKSELVDAPQPAEDRGKKLETTGSKAAKKGDEAKTKKLQSIAFKAGSSALGGISDLFKPPGL